MIKYVVQITCDGQDCNSIISTYAWERGDEALFQLSIRANKKKWVFIDTEHYCPKCAEVYKGDMARDDIEKTLDIYSDNQ